MTRRGRGLATAPGSAVVAGLAAATLALAGCGSSSLSDRALRSDAARACAITQDRTDRIHTPASPAAGEAFLRRGVALLRPELTELRSLRPPSAVAANYRAAVDGFAAQLDALEMTISHLEHGGSPVSAFESLERKLAPIEVREARLWDSLQISACVNR